jgi:hypothetical protein
MASLYLFRVSDGPSPKSMKALGKCCRNEPQGVSVCTFLLLHVLCIILYSTFIQPILVWQWSFILFVEFYAASFFIEWFTRRFSRSKPAERDY